MLVFVTVSLSILGATAAACCAVHAFHRPGTANAPVAVELERV